MQNTQAPLTERLRDVFAGWLGRIFHPFLIAPATILLALYLDGISLLEAAGWTIASLLIVIGPAALFILYNIRRGQFSDFHVTIREQRHSVYAIGIVTLALFLGVVLYFDAPPLLRAMIVAATGAASIGALINGTLTKISGHAAATAGCTATLFWVAPGWGFVLAVATLATGWARIHDDNHTVSQVLLGWVVAITCVVLVFPWLSAA